jgi:hypothetical protein
MFTLRRRLLTIAMTGTAVLLTGMLTSGCGFDAQTLQPYTQAMGVNADVGEDRSVKVRNLLIVSREAGEGFVSASILATKPDALTGVSGTVFQDADAPGAPLTSNLRQPLVLTPAELVVLTERPVIRVTSPLLTPGAALVELEMRFSQAGTLKILVPVYRNQGEYETITPIPRTTPALEADV